jgi:hypothetical protein
MGLSRVNFQAKVVPPTLIERIIGGGTRGMGGVGMERFYVRAPSVNAVRKALGRAPGGVRVIGRFDRETIECGHTMEEHSLARHWSVIVSRLAKAGLAVVARSAPAGELDRRVEEGTRTES